MLLLTPFAYDARVEKEATSLAGAGHRVRVISVASPDLPTRESRDGYEILRVESEPLPARAVRRALALRRTGRGGGGTSAPPGTVVQLVAGPRAGAAAHIADSGRRNALHLHLALHRRA